MATQFSPEHGQPPRRFRPGPGQIGQAAGLAAGKQRAGQGQVERRKPGGRAGAQAKLGMPEKPQPQADAGPPPGDYRHLLALAQHANMRDLGREVPFGVWAILNGIHRQLFQPGQWPADILEDA